MRYVRLGMTFVFILLLLTACWDRTEINDYAFWVGSAIDLNQDGTFKVSAQIAVPSQFRSKGGSESMQGKGVIVVSSTGKSLVEAIQNIQEKLPRKIFIGHRRSVFVGEKMAKSGVKLALDQFVRNPDTRLRTDVFVVKGGEGKSALEVNSPFNPFSAVAAVDQDKYCRIGDIVLRDLLLDATRDGIRPTTPVIEVAASGKQDNDTFIIRAAAMFNKNLELSGILGQEDSMYLFWIKGVLRDRYMMMKIEKGIYSIYESNLKSHIATDISGGKWKARVILGGEGRMMENTTSNDLSESPKLLEVQRTLNEKTKDQVEKMIRSVQKNEGQDVFGFGEVFHREHPYEWKKVKDNWDEIFPTVTVTVEANLHLRSTGKISKPLDF